MTLDLSALDENFTETTAKVVEVTDQDKIHDLSVEILVSGKYQPRTVFDPVKLQELADSIKVQGVLQPIVVRKIAENQYEIIAGERRWRASQLAGLSRIPAIIREIDDRTALAVALVENGQREGLLPLEDAISYQRLKTEFKLKNKEVAEAVGKPVNEVNKLLSLLSLPEVVMAVYERGNRSVDLLLDLGRAFEENQTATEEFLADAAKVFEEKKEDLTVRAVREFRSSLKGAGADKDEKNSTSSFSENNGGETDSGTRSDPSTKGAGSENNGSSETAGESQTTTNTKPDPEPDTGELTSWPKGKAIADPDRLKKPLLLVDYEGRAAAVLLNRKPKSPGVIFIRYEDGGGDELVSVDKLKISQLSEE